MSKKNNKKSVPVTISVAPELFDEFEKYVEDNFIDRSRLIEHLIMKHIQSKKKV